MSSVVIRSSHVEGAPLTYRDLALAKEPFAGDAQNNLDAATETETETDQQDTPDE